MGSENLTKEEYLILKDWEVTKDRIKHFDNVVMTVRVHGIPISTAFLTIGWVLISNNPDLKWVRYVFLFASLYLIPIAFLDFLHYDLMLKSVKHAKKIEKTTPFNNTLKITTKLTSPVLTTFHTVSALLVYGIVIIAGFISFILI